MKGPLVSLLSLLSLTVGAAGPSETLRFDRPASFFEESIVIGNGNLGASIYGGISCDSLSLNDITLWTGAPETGVATKDAYKAIPQIREALNREDYRAADSLQRRLQGHYSESYQPLGTLYISYPQFDSQQPSDYSRNLDLTQAVAEKSFSTTNGKFRSLYFVSAPDSVIVARLSSDSPVDAIISFGSKQPHKLSAEVDQITACGHVASHAMPNYTKLGDKLTYEDGKGMRFATIIKALPLGDGKVEALPDGRLRLSGVKDAVLYVTNVTSFNGFDRDPVADGRDYESLAASRIGNAVSKGYDAILSDHLSDYTPLYSRVNIDLGTTPDSISALPTDVQLLRYTDLREPNPDLEELYFNFGRYLLISCSRTSGVPANLQGLWNEHLVPPWCCSYTTNINVEENYWPAELVGLGELHASTLIPWIKNLSRDGAVSARNYYGVSRGWSAGHNSDIWAMSNPVGLNSGSPKWANWNMGGAWLTSHIFEHYLFNPDTDFLQEYYPVLKGAAEFCLDWLVEKDGELLTSPSTSPENEYLTPDGYAGASLYGGTADLAIIRQCLLDARDAASVLADSAFVAEIDSVLPRLHPYRVGERGNLQEWYHDWADKDPQHRHQSHLYGLFPGRHISPDSTPDLARAAARTLEIKGDKTTGWSTGWRVNLLARLRDAEGARRMYATLLRYVSPDAYDGPDRRSGGGTYPNLLDAHSPFQIDGNFGGTAGVAEMLLQSSPSSIRLLPALPSAWASGFVKGLRARGGFVVDIAWEQGRVVEALVGSERGGSTSVIFPDGCKVDVTLAPGEKILLPCQN